MIAQVKDISDGAQTKEDEFFKIPPDLRKSKFDQVMAMLDREYVFRYFRASLSSPNRHLLMMLPQIGTCRRGTKATRTAEHRNVLVTLCRRSLPTCLIE